VVLGLLVGLLLPPTAADAAMTIGQLTPTPLPTSCNGNSDYLEPSVTGGTLYVAKAAGTITSWSTNTAGTGTYTFKVFRRTSDPDVYRVLAQATSQVLGPGLHTFPTSIPVESGDMIGFNVSGGSSSCTFAIPGDVVLRAAGNLAEGQSAQFATLQDVRLNLEAVLVPFNSFTLTGLTRNRRRGTATLTLEASNPGTVTIAGKGLKLGRAARTFAVARPVSFQIAAAGKRRRQLSRKGAVQLPVTATFAPVGGEASSQAFVVKLKKRRRVPPA
jgi:hypothetical protein